MKQKKEGDICLIGSPSENVMHFPPPDPYSTKVIIKNESGHALRIETYTDEYDQFTVLIKVPSPL